MTARERIVAVLLRILPQPYQYTRRDLMQHFGVSRDTINDDITALRQAGLTIEQDEQYRLALLPEQDFKELRHLQPLSAEDKARLANVLQYLPTREAIYLRKKLESLYDFQQLGLRALRKPALDRLDRLTTAQKNRRQVTLENYRSRSNQVSDRVVEPFHIDTEKDTLQAYDVKLGDSRHFRLSRIERVQLSDAPWQYETAHRVKITDVFRIADNQQVNVHLLLDIFAYNSLTEEFPLSLTYLEKGAADNTYDFQCKVNHQFIGISNFILSNAAHVEILSPVALREKIRVKAEEIAQKFK